MKYLPGSIIINEVGLPPASKTIKPVDMGGIAGGHKYVVNKILFKVTISPK